MPPLTPGDPAPWFTAATSSRPDYSFATVAGRYIVLAFVESSDRPEAGELAGVLAARRGLLDDTRAAFFGVTCDPRDRSEGRVGDDLPGIRWFFDPAREVAGLYQLVDADGGLQSRWLILDPQLRVLAAGPMSAVEQMGEILARLPPPDAHAGTELAAPVLIVPRVFEPQLCAELIELYRSAGGEPSGFMLEVEGKTTLRLDPSHKRRSDYTIADEAVRRACRSRIHRRLAPEILKAFQFKATRIERYLIACYDADPGGFFRAHRDNTTKGTAHRRFAVTVNLNAEAYEGGDLRFPEFGSRTYRAPTGGAAVFSCSLMHEAMPVTRGVRYAFLPFLYDDAAARIRAGNNAFLDEGVTPYAGEA